MSSKKSRRPPDRASALRIQQSLKMARSAHAYVRGSTIKFYEWLEEQKRGTLPEGPAVWICEVMREISARSPRWTGASPSRSEISIRP
jgi:hypothetical protein